MSWGGTELWTSARQWVGKMQSNADSVYNVQRQLFARSERVKGIDFHPVEPWILTTLYSGMFCAGNHGQADIPRSCLHLVLRDAGWYSSAGIETR